MYVVQFHQFARTLYKKVLNGFSSGLIYQISEKHIRQRLASTSNIYILDSSDLRIQTGNVKQATYKFYQLQEKKLLCNHMTVLNHSNLRLCYFYSSSFGGFLAVNAGLL